MTRVTGPTVGDTLDQVTPVTSHGWQADLHVTAVDGGDITVKIQDSADGRTWADLEGGTFTAFTAPAAQRLIGGPTGTVRRYLRATSDGSFTSASYVAAFVRHEAPLDRSGALFTPRIRHAPNPDRAASTAAPAASKPVPAQAERRG